MSQMPWYNPPLKGMIYMTTYCKNIEKLLINSLMDLNNLKLFRDAERIEYGFEYGISGVHDPIDHRVGMYLDWFWDSKASRDLSKQIIKSINHQQLLEIVAILLGNTCCCVICTCSRGGRKFLYREIHEHILNEEYVDIIEEFMYVWRNKYTNKIKYKNSIDEILKFHQVSIDIAVNKLKRNAIVNNGILLKLNMKNSGMFSK